MSKLFYSICMKKIIKLIFQLSNLKFNEKEAIILDKEGKIVKKKRILVNLKNKGFF